MDDHLRHDVGDVLPSGYVLPAGHIQRRKRRYQSRTRIVAGPTRVSVEAEDGRSEGVGHHEHYADRDDVGNLHCGCKLRE